MQSDCHKCMGKLHCGLKFCPILYKFSKIKFKEISDFSGVSPPTIFIGSKLAYPNVNIGVMSPACKVDDINIYDNQRYWGDNDFNINQIAGLRSSLVNSRIKGRVVDARMPNKTIQLLQEIGMSFKPASVDIELKKKIKFSLSFDQINSPFGASGNLRKLDAGNLKIHTKVEKVYSDTDLKSKDAILYLSRNFDEQVLTQLLSIGITGLGKNRKFVSTRNSITAVDDLLGKEIIKEIKNYETINECRFYHGNYLGNYYLVFMFPEVFNYELFEVYLKGSVWNIASGDKVSHDYEDYHGRKNYASECAGGYYAARLGVLEELKRLKRQASILVIRFETPEYYASLGVWVVRESCRKAIKNCEKFDSIEKMFKRASKFGFNLDNFLADSWLLKRIKQQRKLSEF